LVTLFLFASFLSASFLFAQAQVPEWCRPLPRPEYRTLQRVATNDPWFEVYKVAAGVFAIYEPHQSEETISYLIVGNKRAALFDTGMGISDLKKLTGELTPLPIVVLNSHTHNDYVGDNWQFDTIYAMDTEFTRQNARGSREDAQAEIAPDQICGTLPKGFDPKTYSTRPWKITSYIHDGERIDLGGRSLEVLATPGHTPDAISLLDRANGLLFSGALTIPRRSGSTVPKPISMRMMLRSAGWLRWLRRLKRCSARTIFLSRRRRCFSGWSRLSRLFEPARFPRLPAIRDRLFTRSTASLFECARQNPGAEQVPRCSSFHCAAGNV
jgi:glyoxylase-like metal-dependent hydrolase (beta-lactamase superfamily II)